MLRKAGFEKDHFIYFYTQNEDRNGYGAETANRFYPSV